ncbi:permease [Candidatus Peregrinibacteria bacterium]|nr:permease [Candidatus Peregrinibacteria bacterium]
MAIVNYPLFIDSLISFFELIKKILPILLIVFLLIFISNLILDSKRIVKFLGREAGFKGYLFSVIFGIISTGPIYMWYPLLADIKEKGVRDSFIVTFLYNRAVKIPILPMMIYYFGVKFVIVLTIYMIIFSILNGIAVEKSLTYKK